MILELKNRILAALDKLLERQKADKERGIESISPHVHQKYEYICDVEIGETLALIVSVMDILIPEARSEWAKDLADSAFNGREIGWDDFPLLERASCLPEKYWNGDLVEVKLADGRKLSLTKYFHTTPSESDEQTNLSGINSF